MPYALAWQAKIVTNSEHWFIKKKNTQKCKTSVGFISPSKKITEFKTEKGIPLRPV